MRCSLSTWRVERLIVGRTWISGDALVSSRILLQNAENLGLTPGGRLRWQKHDVSFQSGVVQLSRFLLHAQPRIAPATIT